VIPISQGVAGYLLLVVAAIIAVGGMTIRRIVGRKRGSTFVRSIVGRLRESTLVRVLFGPIEDDVLTDDDADTLILIPTLALAAVLACAGAFFVLTDAFYVRFVIFRR
jgi:hypothetical protein